MSSTMNKYFIIYDVEVYPDFFHITFLTPTSTLQLSWYPEMNPELARNGEVLLKKIITHPDAYFVGYNNIRYDDKILKFIASVDYKILDHLFNIWSFSTLIINTDQWWQVYRNIPETEMYKGSVLSSFKSIDLMKLHRLYIGLKTVGVRLQHERLEELPYDPDQPILNDKVKIKNLEEYCLNDCIITQKFFDYSKSELETRFYFDGVYPSVTPVKYLSMSRSVLAKTVVDKWVDESGIEPIILKKIIERVHSTPLSGKELTDKVDYNFKTNEGKSILTAVNNKTFDFTKEVSFKYELEFDDTTYTFGMGGLHSQDAPGYVLCNESDDYQLVVADITSYYPYLIMNLNCINPALYTVVKRFAETVKLRIDAKNSGQKELSEVLKIVINAVSGMLGQPDSILYHKPSHLGMTINGQLLQFQLIEDLVLGGAKIISVNTDGIVFVCQKSALNKTWSIMENWEAKYNYGLEKELCKMFACTATNNYMYTNHNNKGKGVGIFRKKPDISHAGNLNILSIALFDACREFKPISETIFEHDNLFDFCMTQTVGRKFDIYLANLRTGEHLSKLNRVNRWFWSNDYGKVLLKTENNRRLKLANSENCYLANKGTPPNWKQLIDYDRYLEKAEDIFDEIKSNKLY